MYKPTKRGTPRCRLGCSPSTTKCRGGAWKCPKLGALTREHGQDCSRLTPAILNAGGFTGKSKFASLNCFAKLSLPLAWVPPPDWRQPHPTTYHRKKTCPLARHKLARELRLTCRGKKGCTGACKKNPDTAADWQTLKDAKRQAAAKRAAVKKAKLEKAAATAEADEPVANEPDDSDSSHSDSNSNSDDDGQGTHT